MSEMPGNDEYDAGVREMLRVIGQVQESVNMLATRMTLENDDMRDSLVNHMLIEEKQQVKVWDAIRAVELKIDGQGNLAKAFPRKDDGTLDVEGHHDYHHGLITDSRARGRLIAKIKETVAVDGVKIVITAVSILLVLGLKDVASYYFKPQPPEIQAMAPKLVR